MTAAIYNYRHHYFKKKRNYQFMTNISEWEQTLFQLILHAGSAEPLKE